MRRTILSLFVLLFCENFIYSSDNFVIRPREQDFLQLSADQLPIGCSPFHHLKTGMSYGLCIPKISTQNEPEDGEFNQKLAIIITPHFLNIPKTLYKNGYEYESYCLKDENNSPFSLNSVFMRSGWGTSVIVFNEPESPYLNTSWIQNFENHPQDILYTRGVFESAYKEALRFRKLKQVVVIGMGLFGGIIASQMAEQYPNLIDSALSVSSPLGNPDWISAYYGDAVTLSFYFFPQLKALVESQPIPSATPSSTPSLPDHSASPSPSPDTKKRMLSLISGGTNAIKEKIDSVMSFKNIPEFNWPSFITTPKTISQFFAKKTEENAKTDQPNDKISFLEIDIKQFTEFNISDTFHNLNFGDIMNLPANNSLLPDLGSYFTGNSFSSAVSNALSSPSSFFNTITNKNGTSNSTQNSTTDSILTPPTLQPVQIPGIDMSPPVSIPGLDMPPPLSIEPIQIPEMNMSSTIQPIQPPYCTDPVTGQVVLPENSGTLPPSGMEGLPGMPGSNTKKGSSGTLSGTSGASEPNSDDFASNSADYGDFGSNMPDFGSEVPEMSFNSAYSDEDLLNAQDMTSGEFSEQDMSNLGFSDEEMANGGFSEQDMANSGFSDEDMANSGFSEQDMANSGFSEQDMMGGGSGGDGGSSGPDFSSSGNYGNSDEMSPPFSRMISIRKSKNDDIESIKKEIGSDKNIVKPVHRLPKKFNNKKIQKINNLKKINNMKKINHFKKMNTKIPTKIGSSNQVPIKFIGSTKVEENNEMKITEMKKRDYGNIKNTQNSNVKVDTFKVESIMALSERAEADSTKRGPSHALYRGPDGKLYDYYTKEVQSSNPINKNKHNDKELSQLLFQVDIETKPETKSLTETLTPKASINRIPLTTNIQLPLNKKKWENREKIIPKIKKNRIRFSPYPWTQNLVPETSFKNEFVTDMLDKKISKLPYPLDTARSILQILSANPIERAEFTANYLRESFVPFFFNAVDYINEFEAEFQSSPYDNLRVLYEGSDADLRLNSMISRSISGPVATHTQSSMFSLSGKSVTPITLLYSSSDLIAPEWFSVNYLEKLKKNGDSAIFNSVKSTQRNHLQFAQTEVILSLKKLLETANINTSRRQIFILKNREFDQSQNIDPDSVFVDDHAKWVANAVKVLIEKQKNKRGITQ